MQSTSKLLLLLQHNISTLRSPQGQSHYAYHQATTNSSSFTVNSALQTLVGTAKVSCGVNKLRKVHALCIEYPASLVNVLQSAASPPFFAGFIHNAVVHVTVDPVGTQNKYIGAGKASLNLLWHGC